MTVKALLSHRAWDSGPWLARYPYWEKVRLASPQLCPVACWVLERQQSFVEAWVTPDRSSLAQLVPVGPFEAQARDSSWLGVVPDLVGGLTLR